MGCMELLYSSANWATMGSKLGTKRGGKKWEIHYHTDFIKFLLLSSICLLGFTFQSYQSVVVIVVFVFCL